VVCNHAHGSRCQKEALLWNCCVACQHGYTFGPSLTHIPTEGAGGFACLVHASAVWSETLDNQRQPYSSGALHERSSMHLCRDCVPNIKS
jgi:hypothetical protein